MAQRASAPSRSRSARPATRSSPRATRRRFAPLRAGATARRGSGRLSESPKTSPRRTSCGEKRTGQVWRGRTGGGDPSRPRRPPRAVEAEGGRWPGLSATSRGTTPRGRVLRGDGPAPAAALLVVRGGGPRAQGGPTRATSSSTSSTCSRAGWPTVLNAHDLVGIQAESQVAVGIRASRLATRAERVGLATHARTRLGGAAAPGPGAAPSFRRWRRGA